MVAPSFVLTRPLTERIVFRELLQNSDDAGATTVEIHFETQAYMSSKGASSTNGQNEGLGEKVVARKLPDLKSAMVRICHVSLAWIVLMCPV